MEEQLQQSEMTVREAGRRGGEAVRSKYGRDFYARIGRLGGQTVAQEKSPEFYSVIGHKGGRAVRSKHG
ncbi:MAG TPA: hypothetical protein VHL09_08225, partial [Dehalococcoidia bacterium]|nr:hypothetical protein [Dehalococcoidia bacterium]